MIAQKQNTFEQALLIFRSKSDGKGTFLNYVQAHLLHVLFHII